MFRGWILGICYYSWGDYKAAYNRAVLDGVLFDKNGMKITNLLD